jgi:hypothetical protein
VGAIPEVLSRVDPMLVTEGTDGASLAKTLRLVLNRFRERPHERERLSKKSRDVVEQRYNWVAHMADLDRLFMSLLGQEEHPPAGCSKTPLVLPTQPGAPRRPVPQARPQEAKR